MPKLHEILAVDKDKENQARKIVGETLKVFSKAGEYFTGFNKTLKMFDDKDQQAADALAEDRPVTTTVPERLGYTLGFLADTLDVQMAKEATNQVALADITLEDGSIIAEKIPATMLLALERELTHYRQIFAAIPTLSQDKDWELDSARGDHIYKAKQPQMAHRTQKSFEIIELSPATKEHKAQVERVPVEKPVGTWTTQVWSGMVTPHEKASMLDRLEKLIQAVKQARMRANEAEVVTEKIGAKLFNYVTAA